MHHIDDVIVREGKVVLSDLPFSDGQHVRVIVSEVASGNTPKVSIGEVRQRLKGGVAHFDDPFEPLIPFDDWEMLK